MSRLVALSVVVHGLFLVAVFYVPTLRSLLHVAGSMAGLKFVSEDYDPTLIGQRATIVQLAPHEKLVYPSDYFGAPEVAETALAPEAAFVQQVAPPPPQVYYKPRRVRTPKADATAQATPSPSPVSNEVAQATPTPAASPTPSEAERQAEAEMDKIAKESGIARPPVINTKPFEDIAVKGKELVDNGAIDLRNSTLDLTATAERNDDGTLNPDTVKIDGAANNENVAMLAQQLVTALSQSKVLVVLKGAKDVRMVLKLDQQTVSIKVLSEMASEDEATKTATGCAALVAIGRMAKKGTTTGELYNNLRFSNEGKQFTMSFEMPKEAAGKMIADMLQKKAAEAAAQNKS